MDKSQKGYSKPHHDTYIWNALTLLSTRRSKMFVNELTSTSLIIDRAGIEGMIRYKYKAIEQLDDWCFAWKLLLHLSALRIFMQKLSNTIHHQYQHHQSHHRPKVY